MGTLIANHLWQSTLFAGACSVLTLAFHRNPAKVRHWLWLAASLKFLVPFAALVALGNLFSWRTPVPRVARLEARVVTDRFGAPPPSLMPFRTSAVTPTTSTAVIPSALTAMWLVGTVGLLTIWTIKWRHVRQRVRGASPLTEGREVQILRELERAMGCRAALPLLVVDGPIEPGIVGLIHPSMMWPIGISAHLTDAQIEAIMAHEWSHVRRHDNLIAMLQMVVQGVFWFHPLVWYIGTRLVGERERACDEDVIGRGNERVTYAESILKTCQFFVESPLTCVSGVTGADLKRRIEAIMQDGTGEALSWGRRAALTLAGLAAVLTPIGIGVLRAPTLRAQAVHIERQAFEVASVKPNSNVGGRVSMMVQPGGRLNAVGVPLNMLIRFAYQLQGFQVSGAPDWADDERFDIRAKAPGDLPPMMPDTIGPPALMMQSLLRDRFKLSSHFEQREMPMYALVVASGDGRFGPGLTRSAVDCKAVIAAQLERGTPPQVPAAGERQPCGFRIGPGRMVGGGVAMSQLASSLSPFLQRIVVDQTNLAGDFDIDLTFSREEVGELRLKGAAPQPAPDPDRSTLFTALQEQLGLKLQSIRGAVQILVIDHVERPTVD